VLRTSFFGKLIAGTDFDAYTGFLRMGVFHLAQLDKCRGDGPWRAKLPASPVGGHMNFTVGNCRNHPDLSVVCVAVGRLRRLLAVGMLFAAAILAVHPARADIFFTFNYDMSTSIGFNDPMFGATRRAALTDAGNRFSTLFGTHFDHTANIAVTVENIDNISSGVLAYASGNNVLVGSGGYFGAGETVRQKIQSNGTTDINGSADDAAVGVNWAYNWELDPNVSVANDMVLDNLDFYAAMLHEFTHAIGFVSALFPDAMDGMGQDGTSRGGGTRGGIDYGGYWNKFDQFLTDGAGDPLIDPSTFLVDQADFQDAVGGAGSFGSVNFAGSNAVTGYGMPVELLAETNPYDPSNISHLHRQIFNTSMMKPDRAGDVDEARTWNTAEVGILTDLGYTTIPEPGAFVLVGLFTISALLVERTRRLTA
jgi:hypothetical protein